MGAAGFSLPLVPLRGKPRRVTRRVGEALIDTLDSVWRYGLGPWGSTATGWLANGDDSLLTVQADGGPIFWFDDSVEWPESLAEHWLLLALAWRRSSFEQRLRKLGFGIAAESWPRLLATLGQTSRFIEVDGRIGTVDKDKVTWVLGNADTQGSVAIAELPAETRNRIALLADRCLCPMCESHRTSLVPRLEAATDHVLEVLEVQSYISDYEVLRDGGVILSGSAGDGSWTRRRARDSTAWETLHGLSDETLSVVVLREVSDAIVAIVRSGSSRRRQLATTYSTDGGVTWSTPLALPFDEGIRFCHGPHRRDVLYAVSHREAQATIYRSDDGGRTFGPPIVPLFDGTPAVISEILATGKRMIARFSRRNQDSRIAVSDDGGASFTTIPVEARGLWASAAGEIVISQRTEVGVDGRVVEKWFLARSADEGRTWTTCVAPRQIDEIALGRSRWFATAHTAEYGARSLYVSDDEGATWSLAASGAMEKLRIDAADPRCLYVQSRTAGNHSVLVRLAPRQSASTTAS